MKNPEVTARTPSNLTERTIFGEVLDWMLAPLLFLWPISIAATYYLSQNIADMPYDEILGGRLGEIVFSVQRGEAGLASLPSDGLLPSRNEGATTTWYRVVRGDGKHLGGRVELPASPAHHWRADDAGEIVFRNTEFDRLRLRVAQMLLATEDKERDAWVLVEVAESQEKRVQLANNIVATVIVPQFFLIPLALALVGLGLKKGLGSLGHLRETLGGRDVADFSPIPGRSVPEEVEPLVDSFNVMLRRMKRNGDSQRRFIADAAHQIRTPLTGLKMQAQLAARESDPAAIQSALRHIAASVDRATRLSQQLLTLARTESGEIAHQQFEKLDLDTLLRECIEDWVMHALDREIDLGYDPHGDGWVVGNAMLLRELVNNLIDNALRYTPAGGAVTCRVLQNGEFMVLEIEDNGIGVTPEQAELVFERFYRVDDAHSQGSGLGLAIVREIATLHSAYAALRPNPRGKGAVARVVFPSWEDPVADQETEQSYPQEAGLAT